MNRPCNSQSQGSRGWTNGSGSPVTCTEINSISSIPSIIGFRVSCRPRVYSLYWLLAMCLFLCFSPVFPISLDSVFFFPLLNLGGKVAPMHNGALDRVWTRFRGLRACIRTQVPKIRFHSAASGARNGPDVIIEWASSSSSSFIVHHSSFIVDRSSYINRS